MWNQKPKDKHIVRNRQQPLQHHEWFIAFPVFSPRQRCDGSSSRLPSPAVTPVTPSPAPCQWTALRSSGDSRADRRRRQYGVTSSGRLRSLPSPRRPSPNQYSTFTPACDLNVFLCLLCRSGSRRTAHRPAPPSHQPHSSCPFFFWRTV